LPRPCPAVEIVAETIAVEVIEQNPLLASRNLRRHGGSGVRPFLIREWMAGG
jgi:hypothetical protein